jgi:Haem-binding domain
VRKKLKWVLLILGLVVIGLQFTNPPHTNPPIDESKALENMTALPSEVSRVFANSCNDCHSNKTNWRWYTYIAPISWFTVGHVNQGRSELNFSLWGTYSARLKETRLNAICQQSEKGTMPLASYAFVHREVKLSQGQVSTICEWTKQEKERLSAK